MQVHRKQCLKIDIQWGGFICLIGVLCARRSQEKLPKWRRKEALCLNNKLIIKIKITYSPGKCGFFTSMKSSSIAQPLKSPEFISVKKSCTLFPVNKQLFLCYNIYCFLSKLTPPIKTRFEIMKPTFSPIFTHFVDNKWKY